MQSYSVWILVRFTCLHYKIHSELFIRAEQHSVACIKCATQHVPMTVCVIRSDRHFIKKIVHYIVVDIVLYCDSNTWCEGHCQYETMLYFCTYSLLAVTNRNLSLNIAEYMRTRITKANNFLTKQRLSGATALITTDISMTTHGVGAWTYWKEKCIVILWKTSGYI